MYNVHEEPSYIVCVRDESVRTRYEVLTPRVPFQTLFRYETRRVPPSGSRGRRAGSVALMASSHSNPWASASAKKIMPFGASPKLSPTLASGASPLDAAAAQAATSSSASPSLTQLLPPAAVSKAPAAAEAECSWWSLPPHQPHIEQQLQDRLLQTSRHGWIQREPLKHGEPLPPPVSLPLPPPQPLPPPRLPPALAEAETATSSRTKRRRKRKVRVPPDAAPLDAALAEMEVSESEAAEAAEAAQAAEAEEAVLVRAPSRSEPQSRTPDLLHCVADIASLTFVTDRHHDSRSPAAARVDSQLQGEPTVRVARCQRRHPRRIDKR